MVSNFRYYSFKDLDLKGKVPFVAMLLVVLIFVFISIDPPQVLFFLFMAYVLSGPVVTVLGLRKKRAERRAGSGEDEEPGPSESSESSEHKP
jgi:CDP-diacylglycerol--serine O-phosphatidyltransferase